jgi:hypothetical protein
MKTSLEMYELYHNALVGKWKLCCDHISIAWNLNTSVDKVVCKRVSRIKGKLKQFYQTNCMHQFLNCLMQKVTVSKYSNY